MYMYIHTLYTHTHIYIYIYIYIYILHIYAYIYLQKFYTSLSCKSSLKKNGSKIKTEFEKAASLTNSVKKVFSQKFIKFFRKLCLLESLFF